MPAIAATPILSRLKTVGLWVLKIALAALFVLTAWAKLYGVPPMVETFEKVGLGQWFRYFTGVLELLGAALLLWPATAAFGALLLTVVCIGAFFAQLFILHEDAIHAIVLAAILAAIVWTYRDQLRALVGPEP
jgi:putative oxidoreductase